MLFFCRQTVHFKKGVRVVQQIRHPLTERFRVRRNGSTTSTFRKQFSMRHFTSPPQLIGKYAKAFNLFSQVAVPQV